MVAAPAMNARSAAARWDGRVLKEARALLKEADTLRAGKLPAEDARALKDRRDRVAIGVAATDATAVRRELPALDALVDKLSAEVRRSPWREYVESIGIAIMIALLLRAFVVEAFKIPSASMIPTMQIGDFIFVNKFLYGVRVPYTDTKFFDVRAPQRGEVIVFKNPCTPERDFIKRIVAVAGDTVEVRCNHLMVNGQAVPEELVSATCSYWNQDDTTKVWSEDPCSDYRERWGGYSYHTHHEPGRPTSDDQRREREAAGEHLGYASETDDHDFPSVRGDEMPQCDATSKQTAAQRAAARGTLETTPVPADVCGPRKHYVVPAGHVFMMGDNRFNSNDSRAWGPVPVANIKGKAMFIWLSTGEPAKTPFSLRLERIGNFVH